MLGRNTPREFILTPENLLETLLEWMPDQLSAMRQYASGPIKIGDNFSSLQCQYMQTVGGEKFRIVDRTPMGDSGSDYYDPLGADDDIIIAFAARIERGFAFIQKRNRLIKDDQKPLELRMRFEPGPFEEVA